MVTPNPLHYSKMEGKEPHWEVNHYGQISIPSPIAVFPKPIALSYRNLYENFGKHEFLIREEVNDEYPRVYASCALVTSMLSHYFPAQEAKVGLYWPGEEVEGLFKYESIVQDMPAMGTRHYIVQRKKNGKVGHDIVAIVIVVTDPVFFDLNARRQPTTLKVADKYVNRSGRLAIGDNTMSVGAVVILAATSDLKPAFEFYHFDCKQPRKGELIPWASQEMKKTGVTTNSISLDSKLAPAVDSMFREILHEAGIEVNPFGKGVSGTSSGASAAAVTPSKRTATEQSALSMPDRSKRQKTFGKDEDSTESSESALPGEVPRSPTPSSRSRTLSQRGDEIPAPEPEENVQQ